MSEDQTAKLLDNIGNLVEKAKGENQKKDTSAFFLTIHELDKQVRLLSGDRIKVGSIKLP